MELVEIENRIVATYNQYKEIFGESLKKAKHATKC